MADLHTPLGNVPKPMAYIALLAGGGALVYSYVKKNKKTTQAPATPQSGTSPNQSYAYGAYAYGAYTYEPYGYGYGPNGLGSYPNDGQSYYGYGYYGAGVPVQEQVPTSAATNAQWVQAAVTALTAQGYQGSSVQLSLGKYVTGQVLSPADQEVVTAAIGAEGYPPIPGTSGYPPAMNTGGTGGGGTTGQVTVPDVIGENYGQAYNTLFYGNGLKVSPTGVNSKRTVTGQSPTAGSHVTSGSTVTLKLS